MRKSASTMVALSLATAFALTAPAYAQETEQSVVNAAEEALNIIDAARKARYQELTEKLQKTEASHAARRAAIENEIRAENKDLTDAALRLAVEQRFNEEMQARTNERLARTIDAEHGAPFLDIPDNLDGKSVRGCTVDGFIYRLPYELVVNFEELAAVPDGNTAPDEQSLFYRMVQPDPDALLGMSGSAAFMAALNTMTEGIHGSMQIIAGPMIDQATADIITDPVFGKLTAAATQSITDAIRDRYGVSVIIKTGKPEQQEGRCTVKQTQSAPATAPLAP